MPEPTIGTVAFRFTAIQSSTRLLKLAGRLQAALPALHPLFRPPASDRQHSRQPLDAEHHHGEGEEAAVHAEEMLPADEQRRRFPDPAAVTGSDAERLQAFRNVRDALYFQFWQWVTSQLPGQDEQQLERMGEYK
jgi:hypothetical protein